MTVRIAIAFFGALLFADTAAAQTCGPYTYSFTSGTSAVAAQVNANFSTILTCFNNLVSGGTLSGVTLSGTTTLPSSGQISSGGFIGLGMMPTYSLDITQTANTNNPIVRIQNDDTTVSGGATAVFEALNSIGLDGGQAQFGIAGSHYAGYGALSASAAFVYSNGNPIVVGADSAGGGSQPIIFATGTGIHEVARFTANGAFTFGGYFGTGGFTGNGQAAMDASATGGFQIFGKGSTDDLEFYNASSALVGKVPTGTTSVAWGGGTLATNATSGFLYLPTMAGIPTGTPVAQTGYAPIVIDTTDNKVCFYNGSAWKCASGS